jgi:hypothetical protein
MFIILNFAESCRSFLTLFKLFVLGFNCFLIAPFNCLHRNEPRAVCHFIFADPYGKFWKNLQTCCALMTEVYVFLVLFVVKRLKKELLELLELLELQELRELL